MIDKRPLALLDAGLAPSFDGTVSRNGEDVEGLRGKRARTEALRSEGGLKPRVPDRGGTTVRSFSFDDRDATITPHP